MCQKREPQGISAFGNVSLDHRGPMRITDNDFVISSTSGVTEIVLLDAVP